MTVLPFAGALTIRLIRGIRGKQLQWDVSVLLGWVLVALGVEHLQRIDQLLAGVARSEDRIYISLFRGDVRIGESVADRVGLFFAQRRDDLLFLRGWLR